MISKDRKRRKAREYVCECADLRQDGRRNEGNTEAGVELAPEELDAAGLEAVLKLNISLLKRGVKPLQQRIGLADFGLLLLLFCIVCLGLWLGLRLGR